MTERITIHEALEEVMTEKPDWWGYGDDKRTHTEAYETVCNDIKEYSRNITLLSERVKLYESSGFKSPEYMKNNIESYKKAVVCLEDAKKYIVAAGKSGMYHPKYNLALQEAQKLYNIAHKLIDEAVSELYIPLKEEIHKKISSLHDQIYRRMAVNEHSTIRQLHFKLAREHNTLAQIFKENDNPDSDNLNNYSERIITESLNRLGIEDIKSLNIKPESINE